MSIPENLQLLNQGLEKFRQAQLDPIRQNTIFDILKGVNGNSLARKVFTIEEVTKKQDIISGLYPLRTDDIMGENRGIGQRLKEAVSERNYSVKDYANWKEVEPDRADENPIMAIDQQRDYRNMFLNMDLNMFDRQLESMITYIDRQEVLTSKLNNPNVDPIAVILYAISKLKMKPNKIIMTETTYDMIKANPSLKNSLKGLDGTIDQKIKTLLGISILIPDSEHDIFGEEARIIGNNIFFIRADKMMSPNTAGTVFLYRPKMNLVKGTDGYEKNGVIFRWFVDPAVGHMGSIIYKTSMAYDIKVFEKNSFYILKDVIDPSLSSPISLGSPAGSNSGESQNPDLSPIEQRLAALEEQNQKALEANEKLAKELVELKAQGNSGEENPEGQSGGTPPKQD